MNRKELIRAYKETPRPMGTYRVLNTSNGKSLVGASKDVAAILNRHRAQLQIGAHPNRSLQADWNALGPDAFQFEVLDTLAPSDAPNYDPGDDLRVLEELWLDRLSPFDERGYNREKKRAS